MAQLFDPGIFSILTSGAAIGVGYKLNWYTAGTATRTNSFTTSALSVANANPVVADANGRFGQMWLGAGSYKFILTDAADVVKVTVDAYVVAAEAPAFSAALTNFLAGSAALPVANGGTASTTASDARSALAVLGTAGGTVTGSITRSAKGVHLFWETAAMNSGNVFLTASAASDPTSVAGQVWLKY